MQVYFAGLTVGTWKNKSVQANRYLQFCNSHHTNPLSPTNYDLLAYLLQLNESLASPGAVMNYLSGARTWVRMMGGDTEAFDSYPVSLMKRGVQRLSTHKVTQAPPLSVSDLRSAVMFLSSAGPSARVLIAALLIGYTTLLRQGNLLASIAPSDPGHALKTRDITSTPAGLTVTVWSTKTRWRPGQGYTVLLPPIPLSFLCPVVAWARYVAHARPRPLGPAFATPDGAPLQAATLTAALRMALAASGVPHPSAYTLHSLRRGGAQACAAGGAQLVDIMELGAWSSRAVHTYVPKNHITSGPETLAKLIG